MREWFLRVLVAFAALQTSDAIAAACVSQASGNWNAPGTWTACGGGFPSAADTVTILGGFNVTVNVANAAAASVQLGGTAIGSGNGTLTFNAGSALTVSGIITFGNGLRTGSINMTAGGTVTANAFAANLIGAWTPGAGTVVLAATNTLPNNTNFDTFNNLTVSGGTTTLSRNVTIGGNLNVAAGTLNQNGFTVAVGGNLAVGGTMNTDNALAVTGTTTITGTLNITSTTGAKTFTGAFTLSGGTFNNSANGNVTMNGNFTDNGTFTSGTGTYTFSGAAAQSITGTNGGTTTFARLTLNNANDLTLTGTHDVTVTTLLTLTTGNVVTGSNTIYISNGSAIGGAGGADFVIGNLKKAFATGANVARVFEVGTGTTFSPVTVTFASVTTGGDLSVSSTAGSHPQLGASGLDNVTPRKLNRWWTIANSVTSPVAFTTYTAAFTYVAADIDPAPTNSAAFIAMRFASAAWNPTTLSAVPSNTLLTITGETGFGDFAIGEAIGFNINQGSVGRFNAYDQPPTPANAVVGYIGTKIAAASFTLRIIHTSNTGLALQNFTGAVTIDLMNATNNTGTFVNNCGPNWTLIQTQSVTQVAGFNNLNQFTATFTEASAWKEVRVRISGGGQTGCSSDRFSIRPPAFTVASSASNNNSSGAPIVKAGANFTITASFTGYSGTPTINAAQVVGSPTAGTLAGAFAAASGGVATGTFTYSEVGNFGLTADAVIDSNFTAVDQPNDCVVNSTSNAPVNSRFGCSVGQAAIPQTTGTSGFGRFTPDHYFVAAGSTLTNRAAAACAPASTFSYMGEGIALTFTLQARNSAATVTQNYAGAYAKLAPGTIAQLGFGAASGATNFTLLRLDLSAGSAGSFTAGQAPVTATVAIMRLTAQDDPDGPFANTKIGVAPVDADGVTARTADMNVDVDGAGGNDHVQVGANTEIRFGRLRMQNALGSEKLDLPIPIETQYWTGAGFATNTLDSCTTLTRANFALGSYTGNLNACETIVFGTTLAPTVVAFANGVGTMSLTAPCTGSPCAGNDGSVLVTPNLATTPSGNQCAAVGAAGPAATSASRPYLLGHWDDATTTESPAVAATNFDDNPSSKAVFGLYGSQPKNFIFFRENF